MRAVTTATAAAVLRIDRKRLDNLLARLGAEIFGVGRQGVERRIPVAMLEEIALTDELSERLAVPARDAFSLARQLLGRGSLEQQTNDAPLRSTFVGSLDLGPFLHLGVNLQALRADLHARLEAAIESQVRPRRGRPRKIRSRSSGTAELGDS